MWRKPSLKLARPRGKARWSQSSTKVAYAAPLSSFALAMSQPAAASVDRSHAGPCVPTREMRTLFRTIRRPRLLYGGLHCPSCAGERRADTKDDGASSRSRRPTEFAPLATTDALTLTRWGELQSEGHGGCGDDAHRRKKSASAPCHCSDGKVVDARAQFAQRLR
jgi:hypothetical protein